MKLSIVFPVYNEADNLKDLYAEIKSVVASIPYEYEIIAVNDGSRDSGGAILDTLACTDEHFKVIHLSKNYGQTAALSAGFDAATGDVLIPMDADLQNDPHDIPALLKKLDEGYDVVSGWRKKRQDNFLRRIPSLLANKLISSITGVYLHDYGCTLKAYRSSVIKPVRLYGQMHRFMPAYVAWYGARITEVVVNHRPRTRGVSKYGISRTFRVILDLLTVKFLMTYLAKPIHFFGGAGLFITLLGLISGSVAIFLRLVYDIHLVRTPLPLLAVFLTTTGTHLVLMGILAEILIRVYHEPNGKTTYMVRSKVNI